MKSLIKQLSFIFIISFVLNLLWENAHSLLYQNYMGGSITEFILLRATLADAIMISLICAPFIFWLRFKKYDWLIIIIGFILAVIIEQYALSEGKWAYNSLMPIIPILSVGLTPAIQLGLLGYISYKFSLFNN